MIEQIDDKWYRGKFLLIKDQGLVRPGGKTKVFAVQSNVDSSYLGCIKWFTTWRQYVFYPVPGAAFDKKCLRELADFCEMKNKEHRATYTTQPLFSPNRMHPRFRESV